MNCKSLHIFFGSKVLTTARLVFVYDPTDTSGTMVPLGKQTLNPSHIFYRPCSGIWQSVWLESAPAEHISKLDVNADMNGEGKAPSSPNLLYFLTGINSFQCPSPSTARPTALVT